MKSLGRALVSGTLGTTLAVAIACSSQSAHPPLIDPGGQSGVGVGGGIGTGTDATTGDVDAASYLDAPILDAANSGVACGAGVVGSGANLEVDQAQAPALWAGPFEIRGTVTFPETIPTGIKVTLGLADRPINTFSDVEEQATATLPAGVGSVTYAFHHQTTGFFYLMFAADMNQNGAIDAGDFAGFYAGTVAVPVTDGTKATAVVVASAPICGVDWGIGRI